MNLLCIFLAHSGCYTKIPYPWWLTHTKILLLKFMKTGNLRTGCQHANRVLGSYWRPVLIVKVSHSVMSNSLWPHGLYSPWNSPGQNTRVGSLSLLQGIFPTQGLSPGLLHCRWILYQLSHREAQEYWSG